MRQNSVIFKKPDGRYKYWTESDLQVLPSSQRAECLFQIHTISINFALNAHVHAVGKGLLLVPLGDIDLPVYFDAQDNAAQLLLYGPSSIDKFVNGILPVEWCIVPIHSRPAESVTVYKTPLDPLAVLQSQADAETNTVARQHNMDSSGKSQGVKCAWTLPNVEVSLSVTTSSARLIYVAPQPNSIRNKIALQA